MIPRLTPADRANLVAAGLISFPVSPPVPQWMTKKKAALRESRAVIEANSAALLLRLAPYRKRNGAIARIMRLSGLRGGALNHLLTGSQRTVRQPVIDAVNRTLDRMEGANL